MNDNITNRRDLKVLDNGESLEALNLDDFSLIWARLCAAYPRQDLNAQSAEIYYELLKPYTHEQLADAINGILKTSKWFPAISEIIDEIEQTGAKVCPHVFIAASLRIQTAEIRTRQRMMDDSEKYANQRFKEMSEKCAELENRSIELYKRDRELLEKSGLADMRAKLKAINLEIEQQEHVLAMLRRKVKLLDQARILQGEET